MMNGAKPWQVAVIVVGLLAGGVLIFLSVSNNKSIEGDLAKRIFMVDVVTGDLFDVELPKNGIMVPTEHPDTKAETLLPANQEGGVWKVNNRYLVSIPKMKLTTPSKVDGKSGLFTPTSDKPRRVSVQ